MYQLLLYITLSVSLLLQNNNAPDINKRVIEYVNTVIGKKVDRGECWDLAKQALDRSNAAWDGLHQYGTLLNLKKDTVYAGDIIQFKNIRIEYQKDNTIYFQKMEKHTAIVYEVKKHNENFRIAHQNSNGRKYVTVDNLDLSTIISGKTLFYRPVYKKNNP
jgi:hypothetical protein